MKRNILILTAFIIGLFCSFTSVDALTKVNFSEEDNGRIQTTLHFEEGFVGGVELVLKLDGEVFVKNFAFPTSITSKGYKTSYDYNNNTLTVRITTGGVGVSHNLLNSKKELQLGTIEVSSDSGKDVVYKLSESSITIVDNNWDSQVISQEHITLGDKNEFTYVVTTNPENPPVEDDNKDDNEDDNKDDSEEDNNDEEQDSNGGTTNNNNNNNNNNNDNNNNSTNTGNNNNQSNNQNNNQNNSNNENDEEDVPTIEDSTDDNNVADNNNTQDNDNKAEEDELAIWPFVLVIVLAVVAVGFGIYFFVIRKKEDE